MYNRCVIDKDITDNQSTYTDLRLANALFCSRFVTSCTSTCNFV